MATVPDHESTLTRAERARRGLLRDHAGYDKAAPHSSYATTYTQYQPVLGTGIRFATAPTGSRKSTGRKSAREVPASPISTTRSGASAKDPLSSSARLRGRKLFAALGKVQSVPTRWSATPAPVDTYQSVGVGRFDPVRNAGMSADEGQRLRTTTKTSFPDPHLPHSHGDSIEQEMAAMRRADRAQKHRTLVEHESRIRKQSPHQMMVLTNTTAKQATISSLKLTRIA